MLGDSKGTWCELPPDNETMQPQDAGSGLPYGNATNDVLQKCEESTKLSGDNLLGIQAEESKKKEELPLAVASLSRAGVPEYTGKKEKKKRGSWPWWAKVMCVLLILLLALTSWTVAALTRLARLRNTPLQSTSQNKQLEEPFATTPPTLSPTLSPTHVPTQFPTATPQTGTPQAIVLDDDLATLEECDDGFLMGLGCFWMWLLLG